MCTKEACRQGHTRHVPRRQALYSACCVKWTTKHRACTATAKKTDLTRQAVRKALIRGFQMKQRYFMNINLVKAFRTD